MAGLAAKRESALPIQRRRSAVPSQPAPASAGNFRATPQGALRGAIQEPVTVPAEPVGAGAQARRWADYTPTTSMHYEDKSARMIKKASEGPSQLFPPTPSPTVSPARYANFGLPMMGMPLPGLPETSSAASGSPPLQQQQQMAAPAHLLLQHQSSAQSAQSVQSVQSAQSSSPQQQTSPQQQIRQMAGLMLQPGMVPPGQVLYVQMPAQMAPGQTAMQALQLPAGMLPAGVQAGAVVQGWVPQEPVVVQGAVEGAAIAPGGSFHGGQCEDGEGQESVEPQQDVTHLAGRQLFNEAMEHDYLDRPRATTQPLPSPGSAPHGTGRCNPCAWYWKPKGCQNGATCTYCHLCPEGELKNRKKAKVAALRMGAIEPAEASGASNGQQHPAALKLTSLI